MSKEYKVFNSEEREEEATSISTYFFIYTDFKLNHRYTV